jgi:hypothetical protein
MLLLLLLLGRCGTPLEAAFLWPKASCFYPRTAFDSGGRFDSAIKSVTVPLLLGRTMPCGWRRRRILIVNDNDDSIPNRF